MEEGAIVIQECIQNALDKDEGALIGRNGTIELSFMIQPDINLFSTLERNAGIFPRTKESFLKWQKESIEASQSADVLASGWYAPLRIAEKEAFIHWNISAKEIPLRSLEPYYVSSELQWTNLLKGQTVAVVSSFTESAKKQVPYLSEIWHNTCKIPEVDWRWVQTGHPPSVAQGINEWDNAQTWEEAVQRTVAEVIQQDARFAIIGCGGLGMLIAKKLKDRGVIAIVLGGAIQVLFGIKGSRWESHEIISTFWNNAWIWPSEDETPRGANTIEGACYWQKN